jgi:hypothetical protein
MDRRRLADLLRRGFVGPKGTKAALRAWAVLLPLLIFMCWLLVESGRGIFVVVFAISGLGVVIATYRRSA